jgi:Lon protease-like protein
MSIRMHFHPIFFSNVTTLFATPVLKAFPEAYTERGRMIEQEERHSRLDTPIFVCQLSFPGLPTVVHFFEPRYIFCLSWTIRLTPCRYRLMLRRCFQESNPNPCFGMIMPPTAGGGRSSGDEFGTMLEIKSVKMLHDGRSMVETRGTFPFRIMERGTMDGYMVARIERCALFSTVEPGLLIILFFLVKPKKKPYRILDYHSIYPDVFGDADSIPSPLAPIITAEIDIQTTPGAVSGALASLTEIEPTSPRSYAEEIQQLTNACRAFLVQIQRGAAPWVVQRLNYIYGPMPTDPNHFSYWMAMVSIFFSFLSMFGHACSRACKHGMSVHAQSLIETNLQVLPIEDTEKAKLLPVKSPLLRLRLVVHWIEQLNSHWFVGGRATVNLPV